MCPPLYEVTDIKTGAIRLINATMPAQARSFVAKEAYTVAAADAKRVAELFTEGKVAKVEEAKAE